MHGMDVSEFRHSEFLMGYGRVNYEISRLQESEFVACRGLRERIDEPVKYSFFRKHLVESSDRQTEDVVWC